VGRGEGKGTLRGVRRVRSCVSGEIDDIIILIKVSFVQYGEGGKGRSD